MAVTETHVDAPPERCFEVLADPRSYSYWVVGSREIRGADDNWPAEGSRFRHTTVLGVRDHTVVEGVEPNRRLRLRARVRPLGTAFVTLTMRPEPGGSRLRLEEEPADRVSRALFSPLADRLLHHRNVVSIERLKELAEGTVPIPDEDLEEDRAREPGGSRERRPDRAGDLGRGLLAGLAGGVAMSASTALEMRLTRRPPSSVPGEALSRVLAIERLGERGERRLGLIAHFAVAGLTGAGWAALSSGMRGPRARVPLLFWGAALPDAALVPAMGLAPPPWRWSAADMARTAGHHAVFAAATYAAFARLKGSRPEG